MNHRPTLEGKRGYEKTIKDSIQHARLLKGHTKLKFRLDVADFASNEVAAEPKTKQQKSAGTPSLRLDYDSGSDSGLDELPAGNLSKPDSSDNGVGQSHEAVVMDHKSDGPKVTLNVNQGARAEPVELEVNSKVLSEEDPASRSKSDSKPEIESEPQSNSDSDSQSDSDSDSDSEAVLAELQKLRKENGTTASVSNSPNSLEPPKRKSWRSNRPFAKELKATSPKYTSDALASSTHEQFMSKFVR